MHAIIETGGKQYRVAPGDVIRVEKLAGDIGTEVELAVKASFKEGGELVSGGKVTGTIVGADRAAKILVFKFKRKKQYKKTMAKKVLIGAGVVVGLLAASVVILPTVLWGDGVDYSSVVSIKTTSEYQDPALLTKAWALPVAASYRSGLDFQRNGSFCGPTSIVNVLRSLGQSSDQAAVLADTGLSPTFGLMLGGVTLDQLAEVARQKTGKRVTVLRDLDLAAFRAQIQRANDPRTRLTINFHRGPLFGTGGGHHSPIGGYLADQDLVFVLDVNAKYQPWLVKTERLFRAMDTVDMTAHKKRGLLLIEE